MKLSHVSLCGIVGVILAGACVQHHANVQPKPAAVTTPPVSVPSTANAAGPLGDGILAWDGTTKETNVAVNAATADFVFSFTNISASPLVILNVHPSCGCTTAKLPPLPWTIAPGTNGQIGVTVNLAGKSGTLYKTVNVSTSQGSKTLMVKITIPPPAMNVQPKPAAVTTPPVSVPSTANAAGQLGDGILAWDGTMKETNVAANAATADFVFSFTNISASPVVISNVHPSCGCTTAKLPPLPWTIAPGTNGQIGVTVNLAGKSGTIFKTVNVSTDKGSKMLMVKITIPPPGTSTLTDADRARGMAMAKVDRQAVFHGDCATCHEKPGEGKYGKALFDAVCAVCHEAKNRATMVPDLHALKTPTNLEFWQIWIEHGKPGSLMPAFSTTDGGPFSDMQIASLASYLNTAIPSHVPPPAQ
jgi:cytochrome c553